jgi:hypothetical protein
MRFGLIGYGAWGKHHAAVITQTLGGFEHHLFVEIAGSGGQSLLSSRGRSESRDQFALRPSTIYNEYIIPRVKGAGMKGDERRVLFALFMDFC